jgi:hypothetical protein
MTAAITVQSVFHGILEIRSSSQEESISTTINFCQKTRNFRSLSNHRTTNYTLFATTMENATAPPQIILDLWKLRHCPSLWRYHSRRHISIHPLSPNKEIALAASSVSFLFGTKESWWTNNSYKEVVVVVIIVVATIPIPCCLRPARVWYREACDACSHPNPP